MERIICDSFDKERAPVWKFDAESPKTKEFNRKIKAVNNMYDWLYEKGILEKISFEFKDYSDATYFSFDVKDLEPYRKDMENAGFEDTTLAVKHIFDIDYAPCIFTGAIELAWHMSTYRNIAGCVGSSRECSLVKQFNNKAASEVLSIKKDKGIKEAVKHAFVLAEFEPSDLVKSENLDDAIKVASNKTSRQSGNEVDRDFSQSER